MKSISRFGFLTLLTIAIFACSSPSGPSEVPTSSVTLDGAIFEITDAAISSNCLSLTFSVRGYASPADAFPQHGFAPATSIAIRSSIPGLLTDLMPLGGGGGGGGQGEDGRVWMRQEMQYALGAPVAEDTTVPLDITVVLNEAFGRSEALEFQVPVVAGPGGGFCPHPGID